jgi:hypothetical protein
LLRQRHVGAHPDRHDHQVGGQAFAAVDEDGGGGVVALDRLDGPAEVQLDAVPAQLLRDGLGHVRVQGGRMTCGSISTIETASRGARAAPPSPGR